MDKKAQGLPLNTIIIAIIVVIVAVVLIFVFRTYIGKEAEFVGSQLSSLGDCDCDGAANFIDDCDFDPNIQKLEEGQTCGGSGTKWEDCIEYKSPGHKCPPSK